MIDLRRLVAVLPIAAVLSCVGPTVTAEQYRAQVEQAAKSMTGIVVTAQATARLELAGKLLSTTTEVLVSEAERDADSVRSDLEGRQPPDEGSARLRARITDVVARAMRMLSELRSAVRRGDDATERAVAEELSGPRDELQTLP